jgi:hypothetical protein
MIKIIKAIKMIKAIKISDTSPYLTAQPYS